MADAAFCPQCFTRFDRGPAAPAGRASERGAGARGEPTQPPASGPASTTPPAGLPADEPAAVTRTPAGRFLRTGEQLLWACPTCDMENPLEVQACVRCGTEFRSLFETADEAAPAVEPGRARTLSLFFPGLGHRAVGRGAEGLARAVVFAWVLGTAVAIVIVRRKLGLGPFLPLVVLLLASASLIYGLSSIDAGRLAEGGKPLLTSRILLYGMAVLMLATVGTLLFMGVRASQG